MITSDLFFIDSKITIAWVPRDHFNGCKMKFNVMILDTMDEGCWMRHVG